MQHKGIDEPPLLPRLLAEKFISASMPVFLTALGLQLALAFDNGMCFAFKK